jgi:hypothetical protein
MTTYPITTRRLILAGGFAIAIAIAPAAAIVAHPTPQGFTTTAANPDIPEIDGVPCTGADSGACIGLAENAEAAGPQPVPRSTISSSP